MSAFASLFQNPNARCQDYELAPTSDLLQLPQQQLLQQPPLLQQQQPLLESQLQPQQQQQPGYTLEYVNFPLQLTLTETKEQRGSGPRQYIQDGELSFVLNFHSVDARSNVYLIAVVVAHTNDTNNNKNTSMEVPKVEVNLIQETKTFVKADLNSLQNNTDNKGFNLGRNMQDIFHLEISIQLCNGSIVQQRTRSFKLVSRRLLVAAGGKRQRSEDSRDSGLGSSQRPSVTSDTPLGDMHSGTPTPTGCEDYDQELVEARMVVAQHISARVANVNGGDLIVGKTVQSAHGDIAYHFPLHEEHETFEEGEVVGFVNDGNGETHRICKLTLDLATQATLKGVVSRSQYLEAQKPAPDDPTRTETIAMLGVVPVHVVGSVCANEALYVSPTHPGCAVSGRALNAGVLNDASFVGYAFSARKTDDENSLGMVQAAVSILQNAGFKLHADRIRRLEQSVEEKIDKMSKFGNRTRRSIGIAAITLFILLVATGILAWQLLEPGSALRYRICETGRKVPHGRATFTMQPLTDPHLTAIVNGIEFDFEELMKKASHKYQRLELRNERYYLNIDRCAYGYVSKGDVSRNIKPVRGPTVFGVDEECFRPYYYSESSARWTPYNSSSWTHYGNICCEPKSPWKTCGQLRSNILCDKYDRSSSPSNCSS